MDDNVFQKDDVIKVGIVNYLNTKPLLYGLEQAPINQKISIIGDYPSNLVAMLQQGQIDVGLIPVAALLELPNYQIISKYCIGTNGEIASVALFSEVPMHQIEKVLLDYQSRTSVELLKYLMKEYWGIAPELVATKDDNYRSEIKGTTAGLVIGDRAFEQRKQSTYIYDLGSEWHAITGLPFVFAVWVSLKTLSESFKSAFDTANSKGLYHIDEIVDLQKFELFDLKKYYNLHLSYELDAHKIKGMELFLQYLRSKI